MPRQFDMRKRWEKLNKRLPALFPNWGLLIVPEGSDLYEQYGYKYDGFCFFDTKRIHIYIPDDRKFNLEKAIGRECTFDEGFSYIFCHEWYHSLCFETDSVTKDYQRIADDFALTWCKVRGIIK